MRYFLTVLLISVLTACNPAFEENKFVATDITGADFAQTLSLTDHTGKPRSLVDFKGKAVVLFFGYTHCPDVCPTTMIDLKQTMKLLGTHADELQVLFVTLDPARDTQAVLAQFVPSFDERFIGLRGNEQETAVATESFKIYAKKVEAQGKGGYTVDHSAGMYVFDKAGKIRLYIDYGQKPADIANDIKQIL
ncbi:MAG: SCO family protein [Methylotenera sp.]|nr:SCO family protein [Methylotenera sp.]MSP99686.1 SCO family protein [Methylotenera sp.]